MYRIVLLALMASAFAEIIEAPCPEFTRVDDFDFASYAKGIWYEVGRYPNNAEIDGVCGWAEYTFKSENVAKVKNYHLLKNRIKVIEGTHSLAPDAGKSGQIQVRLPYGDDETILEGVILNVLKMKKDEYIIGYYCKNNGKTHEDFSWILSRNKILTPEIKTEIVDFIKESKFLKFSNYLWPSFSDEDCKLVV